jgi:hypothetical protein
MSAYKPITKRPLRAIANRASYGVYDTDGMRICTINKALTFQAEYAALLAAAPSLYEALEGLIKLAETQLDQLATQDGLQNSLALAMAMAALARARGEA